MVSAGLLPSQLQTGAPDLLTSIARDLWAPTILRQEFYHLVLKSERRGAATQATAQQALDAFERLDISFVDDVSWVRRGYCLARALGTGLFDTIYLVAAQDLDAELWTLDQRFLRALGGRYGDRVRTLA